MEVSCNLFIYGTLHPERAPQEIAPVARRLKPLGAATGAATIRGRLLDLGEYPGLVLEDVADCIRPEGGAAFEDVPGEVFEVPDQATLAALDRYEDFRPDDPEASLFLRVEAEVTLHDVRTVMCWVYVYNCNGGIYSCNGRDR